MRCSDRARRPLFGAIKSREREKKELVAKLAGLDATHEAAADRDTVVAKIRAEPGRWHFRCTGHLGQLLRGWFATVQVSEADVDAANAAAQAEGRLDQAAADVTEGCEPCGTRTRDSLLKRQVLYRLS